MYFLPLYKFIDRKFVFLSHTCFVGDKGRNDILHQHGALLLHRFCTSEDTAHDERGRQSSAGVPQPGQWKPSTIDQADRQPIRNFKISFLVSPNRKNSLTLTDDCVSSTPTGLLYTGNGAIEAHGQNVYVSRIFGATSYDHLGTFYL